MNILLWIIQILVALMFLFAGGMKLVMSNEALVAMGPPNQIIFPGGFMKFIGVVEVLGGLGLLLPGIFRRQQYLTPLAAVGLLILMIGAVIVTFIPQGIAGAIPALVIGLLCAFIAYGRTKLRPLS